MAETEVGGLLRSLRERRGLTQGQLGELLGLSKQHVSQIERGETGMTPKLVAGLRESHPDLWEPLTHAMLNDLARRLGVSESEITPAAPPPPKEKLDEAIELFREIRRELYGDGG